MDADEALAYGLIDKICSYDDFKKAYKEFLKNDKISFRVDHDNGSRLSLMAEGS